MTSRFDSKFEELFLAGVPIDQKERELMESLAKNDPFQQQNNKKK